MQNRIDLILPAQVMATIKGHYEGILQQLAFEVVLTTDERKKSGWITSDRSVILMQRAIRSARQYPSLISPQINPDALERDVALIGQLNQIASWIADLNRRVEDTRLYLQKEAGAQALLIYNQLKIAADRGYGGEAAVADMRELMPATGSKRKQKKVAD